MIPEINTLPSLKENIPLAGFTTYRIGGNARFFSEPDTVEELIAVVSWARANGFDWFIIGGGSNILIADDGFPGVVIKLGQSFRSFHIDVENQTVTAGSAVLLPSLGRTLAQNGWEGFVYMCVIPGTVGGAVCVNAGTTNEGEIKDRFVSANVLTEDLNIRSFSCKDLTFSYRNSSLFNSRNIVLSATFRLGRRVGVDSLNRLITKVVRTRKNSQPTVPRNCGSVFKRPSTGKSAGWYIEQAGLKGYQVGDAQVSTEHANWIVNHGNATASDVKSLIELVRSRVHHLFGVELEREVIYVP